VADWLRAVAKWEAEHGGFTEAELEGARHRVRSSRLLIGLRQESAIERITERGLGSLGSPGSGWHQPRKCETSSTVMRVERANRGLHSKSVELRRFDYGGNGRFHMRG
jgi:hypothetical protein